LRFDWQGVCKYNLASYCGVPLYGLTGFKIYAQNEYRYGRTEVAWPSYVEIHFNGDTVVLGRIATVIQVNGMNQSLPYIGKSYSVIHQYYDGYTVFKASTIPLRVSFDGIYSASVEVGHEYATHMCGLCGNFDGTPANDWRMSNGFLAENSTRLGDSWGVPYPVASKVCHATQRKRRDVVPALPSVDSSIAAICGVLGDADGVLGPLVRSTDDSVVKLNIYNCLMDAGYSNGASVYYNLRHFAVVGNVEHADCAVCQVNIVNVLSRFNSECTSGLCLIY
jgi:hypothetical protein